MDFLYSEIVKYDYYELNASEINIKSNIYISDLKKQT